MANNNAVVAAAAADEEAVAEDFEAQHIARAVAFLVRQFFETQASPAPCVDDDVRRRTPSAAAPEVFGAAPRPRVPLEMYVYSLARHLPSVRGVLVGGLVYFDRMLARHPKLDVGGYRGCCAVLLACVVLSMKFWIDRDGVNGRVARAAGVPTELVTKHELYLLELLQYDLFVSGEEYAKYNQLLTGASEVCQHVGSYSGSGECDSSDAESGSDAM
eukprot:TRINITY_DN1937_c0_g1_i2.p3 TRINITY_DN1937_c0_g1~~TRINITY_DN1937_c0_g1_i2.p3  ORF type:complete len:216 (+),score=64.77 TRINITY_DN1937_c0_g1_i2:86-733(+)